MCPAAPSGMGRCVRNNLPGVAFHLTARIQGREPLFRGLEARVVDAILDAARLSGVTLLGFAVMPNHLHLVAVQGPLPLARLMQPLLRRVARAVARAHGREGHVFERRYADRPCLDHSYLRNALAYVHLNPVRALLCDSPDQYPWTSHAAYAGLGAHAALVPDGTELGLRLFAPVERATTDSCRTAYRRFLAWRQAMDAFLADASDAGSMRAPAQPSCDAGEQCWSETFEEAVVRARAWLQDTAARTRRADLGLVVRTALAAETGVSSDLRWLRSGGRAPVLARVRANVVIRCLTAGYSNVQVARYLNISPSTVSRIGTERRRLLVDSSLRRQEVGVGRF
jgi:REP element-mobilizing transposase RayT